MGLIKSAISAVQGTLADQWVDYIRCDAMSENVLMRPGTRVTGPGSSNTKFTDNVITNGSKIDVADGQCMLIVENGKIVDFCQEPGQYTYDMSTQPSLLGNGFQDLKATFQEVGKRWVAGGTPTTTQKVYFVNLLEIHGNKIGLGDIPFRDSEFGFTVKVQGYGNYSYRIVNPLLFYTNLVGNVTTEYRRDKIDAQMKSELISAIQPALGRIAASGVSYDQLINYPTQIGQEVNTEMSPQWEKRRGIRIESIAFDRLTVDDESAEKIAKFQESRVYSNPNMLGAEMGLSQAEAFKNMGKQEGGASGLDMIGMAMAMGAMGQKMPGMPQQGQGTGVPTMPVPPAQQSKSADTWTCACGTVTDAKFCPECGAKRPEKEDPNVWVCECGAKNKGKFCGECGKPKPVGVPQYRCDKCGWEPEDPTHPPKFCPECGDPFGDEDKA